MSVNPSYAGLLNRLEHDIALNVNWRLQPTLLAFIGYQFGLINYTGNEQIGYRHHSSVPSHSTVTTATTGRNMDMSARNILPWII